MIFNLEKFKMSESKCPFHGSTTTPNLGTQNKDCTNQLNLEILRQHSDRSNPCLS